MKRCPFFGVCGGCKYDFASPNYREQKLSEIRPTSIGQAIRISGVNPADISILSIYLKKEYNK